MDSSTACHPEMLKHLKPSQTCCDSIQMPPAKATADDDEALFKRVQVVKALQRVDWGWAFERLAVILTFDGLYSSQNQRQFNWTVLNV